MKEEENSSSYFNFLWRALHVSKKYNLKFQRRLYEELLHTHCYGQGENTVIIPEESYLNYGDLNMLYEYTKRKCQDDNCENVVKYGYIYACYKLKKEKRKVILLMLLDEEYIKYKCKQEVHEKYEKKNIKFYENNFYDVKKLPGHSVGYYIMGKLYEKEAKNEWFNDTKKKKLIDIAFYCYYLCFKSCPLLFCAFKKLLKLHGNFYSNAMFTEEVEKFSKVYNFGVLFYQSWGVCSGVEEEEEEADEDDDDGSDDEEEEEYGAHDEEGYSEEEEDEYGEEDLGECEGGEEMDAYDEEDTEEFEVENADMHMTKNADSHCDEKRSFHKDKSTNWHDTIFEELEFGKDTKSIDVKSAEFILSLIGEEEMNKSFSQWENMFEGEINMIAGDKGTEYISNKAIINLSTLGKLYYHFYVNNFRKCLRLIEEWEDRPIFSTCIFYLKGLCHFLLRNYEQAIIFFEKIHDIECFYTKHLPFLSTCYWYKGDIDKIEHILMSYEKKEVNEDFLCLIGNYFSLKKNKRAALYFFRKAMKKNKFYEYAYILYSCEMKLLGNMRKAALALSKCLQINTCNFKVHLLLSVILFQERNYELANVHLSLCLKINSSDALVCMYCASIYNHQEKYETALLCLEHAQKNAYEGIDLFIMQGVIFLKMKRNEDALSSFSKAQKMNPLCSYVKVLIAFTLMLEKKFEKSEVAIKELILQEENDVNLNFLKDIYECCNLKTVPNERTLNKLELFLREGSFLESFGMIDNANQR
ncbi:anaphase-promoting complex subunit, putative [Plasmodium knowlesi strain H]|uniref:Anaphase-promoting complex subunit, putative n=3 Tax=Plasmodium knowlesi TaxID=5850 RepID=A0A5K1USJ9_PLAKH|nr:anaphase-promoting complex subunit 3, putative [Plasmodium knowlesi strain H]OTN67046.1 putative Anaphase-promoting complex subunit [Plasmodium knowlesi]CAA9988826.1 anaphase-promoting complex subunit 3, putative [Plasmodium knowlesi strain H]SBO21840.1 anaphase-promoting complex subunit, putative [Plasmodium knowlesi strain H]SBO22207.1 anaphase-promoting complex subunit, putative [Plasmodium knowlesi strain H]VVS78300.1 anaphase-promoting complex subunit 3, putative [Plasmodium knowlesi s|eukprot:XP_002259805.1 hypothetical protein, conserved in Plasmodium species [Plasmodium knowlesi strain H]